MNDLPDWVFELVLPVVLLVVIGVFVGGGILGFAGWSERRSCEKKAEALDLEWKWGYFSGCQVLWEGKYTPLESIRFIEGGLD